MAPRVRPAFNLIICAMLLAQLSTAGPITPVQGRAPSTSSPGTIVQQRTIPPGGRTVLTVKTSGLAEVVIFEHTGDGALLREFHAGATPRTARVFTNIRELVFPLASESGADFYIRVRPLIAGDTTLHYSSGTIAQAMSRLRHGRNLARNRGIVVVHRGLHQMPVYQLVPETVIRLEILGGSGTVALLRTRDYLAVRAGTSALARRCSAGSCLRSQTDGKVLGLRLEDYDDRYLVAASDGAPLTFSYQVVATPDSLNYITTCL